MPRVKLFNENEVLTKAMNLFWKKGYAVTSVKDLVNELGINRASLYDTFGDKERLFKKSFELYRKSSKEWLTTFFESRPEVKNGFRELFEHAINEAIEDRDKKGCFVVNTTTELAPDDKKMVEILEKNKQDVERIFYEYLKKGKESGQFNVSNDVRSIASLFYIFYSGLRVVSKVKPNKSELLAPVKVALSLLV